MNRKWTWMAAAAPLALAIACTDSSKAPAEAALAAATAAVESLDGDAARYAPDDVKAVQMSYSTVRDTMANKDYQGVIAFARDIPARAKAAREKAAAVKASLQAAWAEAGNEVSGALDTAGHRIESLAHARRLPPGMDQETLARAESSLASLREGWASVARQHDAGDLPGAVKRAGELRSQAVDLERSLGTP
jgi:hypothetical protein